MLSLLFCYFVICVCMCVCVYVNVYVCVFMFDFPPSPTAQLNDAQAQQKVQEEIKSSIGDLYRRFDNTIHNFIHG